jgi:GNAT superfamily N-acetyltransferase
MRRSLAKRSSRVTDRVAQPPSAVLVSETASRGRLGHIDRLDHIELRPCADAAQLREYIDTYWRRGHVLACDPAMFEFTYCTPWVDRGAFPAGISVLGLYERTRMVGFLGAIVTPYPRPQSYWLALWHVLPELKGTGLGGKLLARMQEIAETAGGWIGTFGAGPEALPVYRKRGYCVRAGRRWVFDPNGVLLPRREGAGGGFQRWPKNPHPALPLRGGGTGQSEHEPSPAWMEYRYRRHPVYRYDVLASGVFRTEDNAWGRVTHVCWLAEDAHADVAAVYAEEAGRAARAGQSYLMDAWAFDAPGAGWTFAPADLPSVFHPVEARGNVTYHTGRPFLVTRIHKGDCDQDRPNTAAPKQ